MQEILKQAKQMAANQQIQDALGLLRGEFDPDADFSTFVRACRWASRLDHPSLRPIRVAFLGGGTLDHTVDFIKFWMLLEGFKLETYVPSYDIWKMEVLNPGSSLFAFRPDYVWFFNTLNDLNVQQNLSADDDEARRITELAYGEFTKLYDLIRQNNPAIQIIQNNIAPTNTRSFGNFEPCLPGSATSLIRRFNYIVARSATDFGIMLFDMENLAFQIGLANWSNPSYWFHSKHPFSPDVAVPIAFYAARLLMAAKGVSKKVIVLDLDNTLWGGVIGDDGIDGIKLGNGADGEAFVAFQEYLKSLASRGIVLAVASKNEEATAKIPFLEHPEMVLKLDDIAAFKANWKNKADNIREIADTLNLGLDSFVFIDDNPAERMLVKNELPSVAVLDLPTDPANYIPALSRMAYFECISFSAEDKARGKMYKENACRTEAMANVTNLGDYLQSLEMIGQCGEGDSYHIPRIAQLINKSNQFHPTTTRYSEAEIRSLVDDKNNVVRWFSLRDRFGDYGLIATLILKREGESYVIDTWAMSCRVLERGMEEFIIRELISLTISAGLTKLIGLYCPTPKNGLVADLYGKLGFTQIELEDDSRSIWELDMSSDRGDRPLYIANGI